MSAPPLALTGDMAKRRAVASKSHVVVVVSRLSILIELAKERRCRHVRLRAVLYSMRRSHAGHYRVFKVLF